MRGVQYPQKRLKYHKAINIYPSHFVTQMAHLYKLEILKEKAFEIVCPNFQVVSKQKEFYKLRYFEILSLIPRQDIVVESEIDVFNAIVRWTDYDRWVLGESWLTHKTAMRQLLWEVKAYQYRMWRISNFSVHCLLPFRML